MKILIDNGHGIDTKGKRSPDGRLLEYVQNRLLAGRIVTALLISIYCNAAGRGDRWLSARGWCAYTTRDNTRADALATSLYTAAQAHLPGHRLRTENLFMDNHDDCDFLLSQEGQQALVDLHVDGITACISGL
ncbi:MAG: hypothetical protein IJ687_07090 [Bacteroidales bacterium]|nr:hypothetical protein [Bacteroidales bacterium]